MDDKLSLYLKMSLIATLTSILIVTGAGQFLFTQKTRVLDLEERTSRLELELALSKVIKPHAECHPNLTGLKAAQVDEFTDLAQLVDSEGHVVLTSNSKTPGLYVEQIRIKTLDLDQSTKSALIEVSVPLRSNRDMLKKIESIRIQVQVGITQGGLLAPCES